MKRHSNSCFLSSRPLNSCTCFVYYSHAYVFSYVLHVFLCMYVRIWSCARRFEIPHERDTPSTPKSLINFYPLVRHKSEVLKMIIAWVFCHFFFFFFLYRDVRERIRWVGVGQRVDIHQACTYLPTYCSYYIIYDISISFLLCIFLYIYMYIYNLTIHIIMYKCCGRCSRKDSRSKGREEFGKTEDNKEGIG